MLYNYVLRKEYLLSKIPRKYARVHKIIKFYQNIRIGYIIFEAIFFLIFYPEKENSQRIDLSIEVKCRLKKNSKKKESKK